MAEIPYIRNYYALFIAIVKGELAQKAANLMGLQFNDKDKEHNGTGRSARYKLDEKDYIKIIEMKKEGKTWREIAKEFKCTPNVALQRLKKYMGEDWKRRPWI